MDFIDNPLPGMLSPVVCADFDGEGPLSLDRLCRDLVEAQKASWPDYRQGCDSLDGVKVRPIPCTGFSVRVQYNPRRIKSALAKVGTKDVGARPCFLCPANLPEAQRGILYRKDYLILCNPMPVFPCHFTVSNIKHRSQTVEEHIGSFLALTADLGNRWTVLYNGPRCGASAPDHLHFQIIPSGNLPVEEEIGEEGRLTSVAAKDGIQVKMAKNMGREVIILEGKEPHALGDAFNAIVEALKAAIGESQEPMMSLVSWYGEGVFRLILFPRAKHRPASFFAEGDARIAVSPAVIEMGGVLVTPMEADFHRLDRQSVENIYNEVSLDGGTTKAVFRNLVLPS
ncbi:MAG TPA: DUF4922 domain-containing protein [Syntrophorhabdaceae bacterium]|jgi:hypothetical protein